MSDSSREVPGQTSDEVILSEAIDFVRKKYAASGLDFDEANEQTWAEIMNLAHEVGDDQAARNRMDNLVSQGFQATSSRVGKISLTKNNTPALAQIGGLIERSRKHRK